MESYLSYVGPGWFSPLNVDHAVFLVRPHAPGTTVP
jgi:hypothetical protein